LTEFVPEISRIALNRSSWARQGEERRDDESENECKGWKEKEEVAQGFTGCGEVAKKSS